MIQLFIMCPTGGGGWVGGGRGSPPTPITEPYKYLLKIKMSKQGLGSKKIVKSLSISQQK